MPDPEQVARELAEELRTLRVEDVLVNALLAVSSIGYRRLGATPDTAADRDLDQVRLAIDTMKAIATVLETFVPPELLQNFAEAVAELQLAYVRAMEENQAPDTRSEAPSAPAPGES
jgi:uncharacterized protein YjaG (DUF416 family)